MRFYVGNLAVETTEQEVRLAFEPFGKVTSVFVPADRRREGRQIALSHSFAYVSMPIPLEARKALAAVKRLQIRGRRLSVEPARSDASSHRHRR